MQKKRIKNTKSTLYTCNEYREEMTLLALRRKLAETELDHDEKAALEKEIVKLEKKIGL